MLCKYCGEEIRAEEQICPFCGEFSGSFSIETNNKNKKTNNMAIAGFICSFFMPLLGWIFGCIGLAKSGDCNGTGKGFSVAALIISTIKLIRFAIQLGLII